jgi:hypothetical protein
MTTPNLELDELVASQSQPHVPINSSLRRLDAVVQLSVLAHTNHPPVSPTDGDRYIVGTNPDGDWVGHDDAIAAYIGVDWEYLTPQAGWLAYVQDPLDTSGTAGIYIYGASSPASWEPLAAAAGGTLDNLSDVNTSGVADGDALVYDSGSSTWIPGAAAGGSYAFVGEAIVAGSAATSITVSGLDLDTDESYFVELALQNVNGTLAEVRLFYNGDTTTSNYHYGQSLVTGAGVASTGSGTDAYVIPLNASGDCVATTTLPIKRDLTGRARCVFQTNGTPGGSDFAMAIRSHRWATVANVTSITFTSSVATAFAVGSYVRIWKRTS